MPPMTRWIDGRTPSRRAAEVHGRRAETLAALLLACKFYRIIGRRVKTPMGELDLIARSPSGILCFVEVKARGAEQEAAEAVTIRQRARIARAAELYIGA
jgi:putative endonuclease